MSSAFETNRRNSNKDKSNTFSLEDTNLVGNVHSLVLTGQTDESLLEAESRDHGVHVLALHVVQLVDGVANLSLVGAEVNEEGEDVLRLVVTHVIALPYLDLLHSRLGDNGLLDDGVDVHLVVLRDGSSLVLGLASELQSVRAEEVGVGVNLAHSLLLFTLNLLSSSSSYNGVRLHPFSISVETRRRNTHL